MIQQNCVCSTDISSSSSNGRNFGMFCQLFTKHPSVLVVLLLVLEVVIIVALICFLQLFTQYPVCEEPSIPCGDI